MKFEGVFDNLLIRVHALSEDVVIPSNVSVAVVGCSYCGPGYSITRSKSVVSLLGSTGSFAAEELLELDRYRLALRIACSSYVLHSPLGVVECINV